MEISTKHAPKTQKLYKKSTPHHPKIPFVPPLPAHQPILDVRAAAAGFQGHGEGVVFVGAWNAKFKINQKFNCKKCKNLETKPQNLTQNQPQTYCSARSPA